MTTGKSIAEQEKEFNAQLRRVRQTPDKSSAIRKDFLQKLIDLSHSEHSALKKYAATNFKECFKDFPDLEDHVINAVYDLCEDPDAQVRMKGYEAISDMSAAASKWVKRNVDVLVQLLQTDDRDEVLVVKKALSRHMDLDTRATWGVFVDQVNPPGEPASDDEREGREHIRALMLSYLANEARPHIQRHAVRAENEEVLITGLLRAVPKLSPKDVVVVKDILLQLPSYKKLSARGHDLLRAVLDRLFPVLGKDLEIGRLSPDALLFLDLVGEIATTNHIAHPYWLLKFYQNHVLRQEVFVKLSKEDRLVVSGHITDALAASRDTGELLPPADGPNISQLGELMNKVLDESAFMFHTLADVNLPDKRSEQMCYILLTACEQRKQATSCLYPNHVVEAMWRVHNMLQGMPPEKPGGDARAAALHQIRFLTNSKRPQERDARAKAGKAPAHARRDEQRGAQHPGRFKAEDNVATARARPPRGPDGRTPLSHIREQRKASPPPLAAPRGPREDRRRRSRTRTPPEGPRPRSNSPPAGRPKLPLPERARSPPRTWSLARHKMSPAASRPRSPPVQPAVEARPPTSPGPSKAPVPASAPSSALTAPAADRGPAVARARDEFAPPRPPSRPQADREPNGRGTPLLSFVGAAKREAPADEARSSKRPRKGDDPASFVPSHSPAIEGGSLLNRLDGQGKVSEADRRRADLPKKPLEALQEVHITPPLSSQGDDRWGDEGISIKGSGASGLSIKGAAVKANRQPTEGQPAAGPRSGSLLSRMESVNGLERNKRDDERRGGGAGGGGGDVRYQERRARAHGQWR